mmetsp:Transcript_32525/g.74313  ORF Transcript_32525/g.74313 Transcript_32525/m.74313 type:complete len:218 (+) Transcript_32525:83-736(+)
MGCLRDEEIVHPERISPVLKCGICLEVFKEPVFFAGKPCQHCFCRSCITTALSFHRRCPTCRKEVPEENDLYPHEGFRNIIDEIIVRCGEHHCAWTGRLDARASHHEECVHRRAHLANAQQQETVEKCAQLQATLSSTQARVHELEGEVAELRRNMQECQACTALVLLALGASQSRAAAPAPEEVEGYWPPGGGLIEMRSISIADRGQRRLGGLHED